MYIHKKKCMCNGSSLYCLLGGTSSSSHHSGVTACTLYGKPHLKKQQDFEIRGPKKGLYVQNAAHFLTTDEAPLHTNRVSHLSSQEQFCQLPPLLGTGKNSWANVSLWRRNMLIVARVSTIKLQKSSAQCSQCWRGKPEQDSVQPLGLLPSETSKLCFTAHRH